jgi:hypothetical protein
MSIREACRPAVIAALRGLSTNAQPDWKDARWLGGYLTSSALGATGMLALSVLTRNLRAATSGQQGYDGTGGFYNGDACSLTGRI